MGPGSKMKRSHLRLAPFFQIPLIIFCDHLFDLGPIFECYTQRMERIGFPDTDLYDNLLKENWLKYSNFLVADLAITRDLFLLFLIVSKGKTLRADRKKILISLITGKPVSVTIALLLWSQRFFYFFFILL